MFPIILFTLGIVMTVFGIWEFVVRRRLGNILELLFQQVAKELDEECVQKTGSVDVSKMPLVMFQVRQNRRRQQIGLLIAVAGIGIMIATCIPARVEWFGYLLGAWLTVAGCLMWIVLLALIDMVSIRLYYKRLVAMNEVEARKVQENITHHMGS